MMTDDETDEFVECLLDACRQSSLPVSAMRYDTCRCPFGALLPECGPRPNSLDAEHSLEARFAHLHAVPSYSQISDFMYGFDAISLEACTLARRPEPFIQLGLMFRKLYP